MKADGKRYIYYPSRTSVFTLWHLSDIHWMSRACAENRIREDIRAIQKDPYSFWLGGGDYCDFIGYNDKRFDPDCVAQWVKVKDLGDLGKTGMRQIAELFRPIAPKCLGLVLGNHEKKYELHTEHESLHGWLCEEIGVRNLEYSAFLDLLFIRQPRRKEIALSRACLHKDGKISGVTMPARFRLFVHHGAGYAQTPGGKLNRLIQFMRAFEADIYFTGHVHDKVARKEPMLTADANCNRIRQHERLGVIAGSYLKTYQQDVTTYGEQRGYLPVSLGAAKVQITPETQYAEAII